MSVVKRLGIRQERERAKTRREGQSGGKRAKGKKAANAEGDEGRLKDASYTGQTVCKTESQQDSD